jgi:hypothetical protein
LWGVCIGDEWGFSSFHLPHRVRAEGNLDLSMGLLQFLHLKIPGILLLEALHRPLSPSKLDIENV